MKKMMFIFVMLVMVAMSANAQRIAEQRYENGVAVAYLENGQRVNMSDLPAARYRNGETIQQGIARTQYEDASAYAARFRVNNSYGYGMYGAGMYPVYGGSGSTFSIGNEHWGFSTGSSEFGGYKTSGTGIRIGSFHIGTSKSGYTQPSYNNGTSYEAAPTASQKKAAAKAAAKRYSQMRAAGVTSNGNTNSNSNSNVTTSTGASVLLY